MGELAREHQIEGQPDRHVDLVLVAGERVAAGSAANFFCCDAMQTCHSPVRAFEAAHGKEIAALISYSLSFALELRDATDLKKVRRPSVVGGRPSITAGSVESRLCRETNGCFWRNAG